MLRLRNRAIRYVRTDKRTEPKCRKASRLTKGMKKSVFPSTFLPVKITFFLRITIVVCFCTMLAE